MRLLDVQVELPSRSVPLKLYALGDIHVGALNCAEDEFMKMVRIIAKEPHALWVGGGDYCMSLYTKVLCKTGFKYWNEIEVGEDVAAFDGDKIVWTPLRGIYLTEDQEFMRLHNTMFDVRCTKKHGWWVHDSHKARREGVESEAKKVNTEDLKTSHRIVVAADAMEAEAELALSVEEATLLAWVVTDGHIRRDSGRAHIFQKKEPYATEIREQLGSWFTSIVGDVESGYNYNIITSKWRALLARIGVTADRLKVELPGLTTRISKEARQAMFDTMLKAEGWEEGRWRFSQLPGPVMDAFQILATLLGRRLTPAHPMKNGVEVCSVVERSKHVTVADLTIEDSGREAAWCPMTDHKSWVCQQESGQVTITGNCDSVILGDVKRFDVNVLPNWMLTGNAAKVRTQVRDIVAAQKRRFLRMVEPIKDKCVGLIEGNHEYSIMKYHNRDLMGDLTDSLQVPNLSDTAFIRFRCRIPRKGKDTGAKARTVTAFVAHGHGGGRTAGAEPLKLEQLAKDKDCDIVLRGHSHIFHILPAITMLGIPHAGKLPELPVTREKHAANWGAYVYTYQVGPSTYASRANYPVRPFYTVETIIHPFKHANGERENPDITMREHRL